MKTFIYTWILRRPEDLLEVGQREVEIKQRDQGSCPSDPGATMNHHLFGPLRFEVEIQQLLQQRPDDVVVGVAGNPVVRPSSPLWSLSEASTNEKDTDLKLAHCPLLPSRVFGEVRLDREDPLDDLVPDVLLALEADLELLFSSTERELHRFERPWPVMLALALNSRREK